MPPPSLMPAAYITSVGAAEEIRFGELPVPSAGAGELLIRAEAMAVNHVDLFVRSGAYRTELPSPFIIGRDVVGRVAEVGAGVSEFTVGDAVWCNSLGYDGRQGSFSRYVSAPVERTYRLPDGRDPAYAVSLLHPLATAHLGLIREAGVRPGDTVFIGGGGGGVGGAAVQLAAALGARVIASTSADQLELVRQYGAETVLDRDAAPVAEQLADAAADGVDVHWENSGRHDFHATLPLLRRGGRVIIAAGLGNEAVLPVGQLYTRDASLRGFAITNASVSDLADAAVTVNRMLSDSVATRIGARFLLSQAAQAHAWLESGGTRGRIVVVDDETG